MYVYVNIYSDDNYNAKCNGVYMQPEDAIKAMRLFYRHDQNIVEIIKKHEEDMCEELTRDYLDDEVILNDYIMADECIIVDENYRILKMEVC